MNMQSFATTFYTDVNVYIWILKQGYSEIVKNSPPDTVLAGIERYKKKIVNI